MRAGMSNGSTLEVSSTGLDQSREQGRAWQSPASDGNYHQAMATSGSSDPRVIAFGRFVDRALVEARDIRGLTTKQIEKVTGVPTSTVYRWRRAEIDNPQRDLVIRFCEGLEIPVRTAGQILGWDGSDRVPEPEPFDDPDMRAVEHKLRDPSVSDAEKMTIRATLRFLARGGR